MRFLIKLWNEPKKITSRVSISGRLLECHTSFIWGNRIYSDPLCSLKFVVAREWYSAPKHNQRPITAALDRSALPNKHGCPASPTWGPKCWVHCHLVDIHYVHNMQFLLQCFLVTHMLVVSLVRFFSRCIKEGDNSCLKNVSLWGYTWAVY